jgi:hypothetical protein
VSCGQYSAITGGIQAKTYLYGQQANSSGQFSAAGDSQYSHFVVRREATLNASQTAILSLDGTGVTNLIALDGNNRAWAITVEWVLVCTVLGTGTSGGLGVGDVHTGTDAFMVDKVSGTTTISTITSIVNKNTGGIGSADVTYAVGTGNTLQVTMVAPTNAGTASTFRTTATIRVSETAW